MNIGLFLLSVSIAFFTYAFARDRRLSSSDSIDVVASIKPVVDESSPAIQNDAEERTPVDRTSSLAGNSYRRWRSFSNESARYQIDTNAYTSENLKTIYGWHVALGAPLHLRAGDQVDLPYPMSVAIRREGTPDEPPYSINNEMHVINPESELEKFLFQRKFSSNSSKKVKI